ncbi:cadherin-like protein 26 isoform 2-T2 [Spinachia spinachia]
MSTTHLCFYLVLCLGVDFLKSSSPGILKRQKRNWIIDSMSIDEGYKGEFPYTLDKIKIRDGFTYFVINGPGVDEEPKDVLRIDKTTGLITVHRPVDFEQYQIFMVKFSAVNLKSKETVAHLGLEIRISDANDNPPKFDHDWYNISTKEATSQGQQLITLMVTDKDRSEQYQLFDLKIVSVHPEPSDLEFYITRRRQTGTISFKGCLDHETAEKYTLVVEASGQGAGPQLSSSSTVVIHVEDGNNHLPVITGQTGLGSVREGEENVLIKRLQVSDSDGRGTKAWRAKYRIQGDANNHFRISTDPETNEGLLFVEKHLDYEDGRVKNLTISVENEMPYVWCEVVERSATGLWKITTGGAAPDTPGTSSSRVTVIVEDVNEPPAFTPPQKVVALLENAEVGKHLVTFTAVDPDVASGDTVVYKKGDDPADWVKVEPETGKVTTSKVTDRESTFVKDGVYTVTVYAIDNGQPPMTGTATLNIQILDQNDNAPSLAVSAVDMCQSEGRSLVNITAWDPDAPPFGGPFTFQLRGKEAAMWKLDGEQGDSVNLVKGGAVPSGEYQLLLDVLDLQGVRASHYVSVTVCTCENATTPNCPNGRAYSSAVGVRALAVAFSAIVLLAGVLLLALLVSCKKSFAPPEAGEQSLMQSNTENPGSDCTVRWLNWDQIPDKQRPSPNPSGGMWQDQINFSTQQGYASKRGSGASTTKSQHRNTDTRWIDHTWVGGNGSSANQIDHTWVGGNGSSANQDLVWINNTVLSGKLQQKLSALQEPGEELGDYAAHVYAEEGDEGGARCQLDAISVCDTSSGPDLDVDMDPRFNGLVSICMESRNRLPDNVGQGR